MSRRRRLVAGGSAWCFTSVAVQQYSGCFLSHGASAPSTRLVQRTASRSATPTTAHHLGNNGMSNGNCAPLCLGLVAGMALGVTSRKRAPTASCRSAVGDEAPGWSLPDETGRMLSPEAFEGKQLMIWWYPKADTGG
mmetsp:Transcript_27752/g.54479  ORF Transcript_27752/g.54479 Transcript_27752/m.54479 type:complete len:137 (-) Transcript_27752:500-910(-)